ncbi:hypothetical protein GOP47_0024578 [Adiantum capillus-veneris]|uniref:Uncharacterized protein n=1 Tax=Adiantum capillus-veneris TaxID=13818 RepID=A0A9D4Z2U0_ADICA|nr:hypothetical protein GOP47_0024578 [Adiantum capillus-veneris]
MWGTLVMRQPGLSYGNMVGASPFDEKMHGDWVTDVVMEIQRGMYSEFLYGLFAGPNLFKVDPLGLVSIRMQLSKRVQVLLWRHMYGAEDGMDGQFSAMIPSMRYPLVGDARSLVMGC